MLARLLCWLGCSTIGGLAVTLSFMNGLPDDARATVKRPPVAKADEKKAEPAAKVTPPSIEKRTVAKPVM